MAESFSQQNRGGFSVLPFTEAAMDDKSPRWIASAVSETSPAQEPSWTGSSWGAGQSPILDVPPKRRIPGGAKVGTSFMQAYNAMRGPQQAEPAAFVEALHPLGMPAHFREGDETELALPFPSLPSLLSFFFSADTSRLF